MPTLPKEHLPIPPHPWDAEERAVAALVEAASALGNANDAEAVAAVERAIGTLQADPDWRDRSESAWRRAGGHARRAATATTDAIRTQAARAAEGLSTAQAAVAHKGRDLGSSVATGAGAGFAVAQEAIAGFAGNLDFASLPAEHLTKFMTAGTRGIYRSLAEARLVWETIPEPLRALGPEEVAKRLDGFDWSHVVPHSKGGSDEASNGIFELAGVNRARGAERMTPAEMQAAQQVLANGAFHAALGEVARRALAGAAVAAAVACVLACLEHGLEYQRGDITRAEAYRRIGRAVAQSAAVGASVAGLMATLALAFPALIPLAAPLMLPLAVLGFCAVGGKVVHLAKGWYELLQDIDTRRLLPDRPILALPPA